MKRARLLAARGLVVALASSLAALPRAGLAQDSTQSESGSTESNDGSVVLDASSDNDAGANEPDAGAPAAMGALNADATAAERGVNQPDDGTRSADGDGSSNSEQGLSSGSRRTRRSSIDEEATRPRRRRRHVRRRARGPRRARPPVVTMGWRITAIPTEGVPGTTHAINLALQPASRYRAAPRYMRFAIGGEVAFREGTLGRTDGIVWLTIGLGAQLPGRVVTPYAAAVTYFGFANRYRFSRYMFDPAYTIGLEVGADLRAVGFAGLGLAVGVGRTVIGDQYSYAGWFRATLALW